MEQRLKLMAEEIKSHVTIYDLRIHRTIGVGRFGRIKLCIHKPTGAVYALKSLRKAKSSRRNGIDPLVGWWPCRAIVMIINHGW